MSAQIDATDTASPYRRVITGRSAGVQLADTLGMLLAAEILSPGRRLILHAPGLADLPLWDNRTDAFRTVLPDLGFRTVTLSETVRELLLRGVQVDLAARDRERSRPFTERLGVILSGAVLPGQARMLFRADAPGPGLSADGWSLIGDFEWTPAGPVPLASPAVLDVSADTAARTREEWNRYWEEHGHAAATLP